MNKAIPITQKCKSPIKLAPILGMLAKKVIVGKIAEKAKKATPLKDINNFRHDRRDYGKSKYKKGSL
tara:strand:- start:336 stop:536 length:201 start_codon:yes stop_codon:yes gene_type:complete